MRASTRKKIERAIRRFIRELMRLELERARKL